MRTGWSTVWFVLAVVSGIAALGQVVDIPADVSGSERVGRVVGAFLIPLAFLVAALKTARTAELRVRERERSRRGR